MKNRTEWNGESCEARRVRVVIGPCPFPQGWYKDLVGQEINAVEIKYGDEIFYLADDDGNGWHKVTVEGGGPHWGHKSLEVEKVIRERQQKDLTVKDCHCAHIAVARSN